MRGKPSVKHRPAGPAGIQIRGMAESDLDEVVSIENASYPVPWVRGMFLQELRGNDHAVLWVALDAPSERVAGYVCFWLLLDELHLLNVAVSPAHRNRGLGRELIRRTLDYGRDHGARKAILEVRVSNPAALKLYDQFGFAVVGVRPRYYREPAEDGLVMVLDDLNTNHRGGYVMADEGKVREELMKENFEFRKLYNEHLNLDNKIRKMTRRKILTPPEEIHRKQLQVEKLKAKDRMESIVRSHLKAGSPSE